jgi:nitrogenase-stabilizing/protective protein
MPSAVSAGSFGSDLESRMSGLESAEDFLEFFGVDFDPQVVRVNRLHILQRFHDYLQRADVTDHAALRACLARAYGDFVRSDALTERVFRVHQRAAGIATVPLTAIGRRRAP